MDTKRTLTHLIKAARDALHLENTMKDLGYKETPYYNLYGEISEAIYCMLSEDTDSFDESLTYAAIHDIFTPDEICAEQLASMCDTGNMCDTSDIPPSTKEIITETAESRGISVDNMVNLILSEWAFRQQLVSHK